MPKTLFRYNPFEGKIDQMPVYGDQYAEVEDRTVSITTSDVFQAKLDFTTPILKPGAIYELCVSYGWNHDATNSDFEARVFDVDLNTALDYLNGWHRVEPQDAGGNWEGTGTDQRFYASRRFRIAGAGAVRNLSLQYRTDVAGVASSIWEAYINIKRVL